MLSARLNSQLKPGLIVILGKVLESINREIGFDFCFLDENPSNSSVGFQMGCAYACETLNKYIEIIFFLR